MGAAAPRGDDGIPAAMRTPALTPPQERWALAAICWILGYQGYTASINGVGAPFIAESFLLDDAGIATLYAWMAPAAFGVLYLSRLADRVGRRRVLLACMAITPIAALAAAAAQSVVLFAILDIVLYAAIGGAVSVAVVMLAEALPLALRAQGQSLGGLAAALGAGLGLIVMPLLAGGGYSWRWLLVIAGFGLLSLPILARAIPESRRWERAAERGATHSVGFLDVLGPRHRRRTLPILAFAFLSVMAAGPAQGWGYYHAVSVVGLSAATASAVVLISGGLAMVGFPLGAWWCERAGRVPTVVTTCLAGGVGALIFYWGPPAGSAVPALWLGVGYFGLVAATNAVTVGVRAASTELFPTALRSTLLGWSALLGAVGAWVAQIAVALLAGPAGGLSPVVGYLALLALPGALVFGLFVDETRGIPLDMAAGEPGP